MTGCPEELYNALLIIAQHFNLMLVALALGIFLGGVIVSLWYECRYNAAIRMQRIFDRTKYVGMNPRPGKWRRWLRRHGWSAGRD